MDFRTTFTWPFVIRIKTVPMTPGRPNAMTLIVMIKKTQATIEIAHNLKVVL